MTDKKINEFLRICFERPWRIVEPLYVGEGEWGARLFSIRDDDGTLCALKYVPAPAARSGEIRREAETMRLLCEADGLLHLEEFILLDDGDVCALLIRMEKCVSLAQIMDEEAVTPEEAEKISVDLLRGVCSCHASGVAHRDIKPQNIFRDNRGRYLVGDFGISRVMTPDVSLTATARNLCTPLYAPPEVIRDCATDWFRVDVYAVGLVMYQLFNEGILPFGPRGQEALIRRRCDGDDFPMPVKAPDAVASVIRKALQFAPEDRYANAPEMAEDLERALGGAEPAALDEYLRDTALRAYAEGDAERAWRIFSSRDGREWARRGMGLCLFYGAGVDRDAPKGVELLRDSADSGDPEAACCLGMYYYSSDERDYVRAAQYFRRAAEAGNAEAQFRLGYCLTEGLGVDADAGEAAAWFEKAAVQGHMGARTYLAPDQKLWEAFDWMPVDGGQALQITRCRRIEDGTVRIPESIEDKPVVSLGAYLFVDAHPQSDSTDHKPTLYTQTREDIRRIELPRQLREIHPKALYGCTALEEIALAEGNASFKTVEGLLYTADGKTLVKCPAAAREIALSAETEIIADRALFGCAGLKRIDLPSSIQTIGRAAFCGCASLETLELPEGLEEIGDEAFTFCKSLRQISFPGSVRRVGEHILSWRYGTLPICPEGSLMASYLSEYCPYDTRTPPSDESVQAVGAAILRAMVLLAFTYTRHPDGVPRTSGSYGLVMQARKLLLAEGGEEAVALALSMFAAQYPQHVEELKGYWHENDG